MKVTLLLSALGALFTTTTAFSLSVDWPPASAQDPITITDSSVSNCGSPDDIWHPEYIKINPDPPRRGEQLEIDVKGILDETVDKGAYVDVTVKLGIIKLLDKRFDLCDEAQNINKTCPIEKGEERITHSVELPRELPPGKYQIHVDVYNFNDKHAACIDAEFRLNFA
ncbi:Phosphatidylglycerol/phosphatidylinositol transfer protein [Borealophlyctis nickersoniae]|nr:Phosphatidylglycerol/phosphatidylinositol transfer protein [Borealophlyctis nickersoniae]